MIAAHELDQAILQLLFFRVKTICRGPLVSENNTRVMFAIVECAFLTSCCTLSDLDESRVHM